MIVPSPGDGQRYLAAHFVASQNASSAGKEASAASDSGPTVEVLVSAASVRKPNSLSRCRGIPSEREVWYTLSQSADERTWKYQEGVVPALPLSNYSHGHVSRDLRVSEDSSRSPE